MSGSEDLLKDQLSLLAGGLLDEEMEERSSEETMNPSETTNTSTDIQENFPTLMNNSSSNSATPESPKSYLSPTLLSLPSESLPKKDFACMFCPGAMWLIKGDALLCYCRIMSSVSFTMAEDDATPVLFCDGLSLALEGAK